MAYHLVIDTKRSGTDVHREYIQRESKRNTVKVCRGCHSPIKIGQLYWDYSNRIKYHDLCFREKWKGVK